MRTFGDWNDPPPGLVEFDFVAHTSATGSFVRTVVLTDVATGWTECVLPHLHCSSRRDAHKPRRAVGYAEPQSYFSKDTAKPPGRLVLPDQPVQETLCRLDRILDLHALRMSAPGEYTLAGGAVSPPARAANFEL